MSKKSECNKCGDKDSKKYWDFEDGTMLCNDCHKHYSDEWQNEIYRRKNKIAWLELPWWAYILILLGVMILIGTIFNVDSYNLGTTSVTILAIFFGIRAGYKNRKQPK